MLLLSLEVSYQMALGKIFFLSNPSCDSLEVSENERRPPTVTGRLGPTARAWGSAIRGWVQPL